MEYAPVILSSLLAGIALLASRPGQPPLEIAAGALLLRFDAGGALAEVRGARGVLLRGAPGRDLWRLRFRDGRVVGSASSSSSFRSERLPAGELLLRWSPPGAEVTVRATASAAGIDLSASVRSDRADLLTVEMPADLPVPGTGLRRVVFPCDMGIGLKPGFFARQPADGAWETVAVGGDPLVRVAGVGCALRPVGDAPAPASVPEVGRALLGPAVAAAWDGRRVTANRPWSAPPDLTLVDTPNGAFVAGRRVGRGMLIRFCGATPRRDGALTARTVMAALAALRTAPAAGGLAALKPERREVVLIAPTRGPLNGGWCDVSVDEWVRAMLADAGLRAAGLEVRLATSGAHLRAALDRSGTFAIVNPCGEALPVGDAEPAAVHTAVRRFLETGGIWVETGGWPFWYALRNEMWSRIDTRDGAFSDFAQIESVVGTLAVFGVQPADPAGAVVVPTSWSAAGGPDGGGLGRAWHTFGPRGVTVDLPPVRFVADHGLQDALAAYGEANRLLRPLTAKVNPRVMDRFRTAPIGLLSAQDLRSEAALISQLRSPFIIHIWDFLRGGFDRELPDHLPPNPSRGTGADLAALIRRAHDLGHLVMPYTNPTWWCDAPRGPTFVREGEAPLLRDLEGRMVREEYPPNWGWSVSPWHPAIRSAAATVLRQFTSEYPADILFQDQVGARSKPIYDLNAASPTPFAYLQGIVNQAAEASALLPTATENGHDRLLPHTSLFCGMHWPLAPYPEVPEWLGWLRPYSSRFRDDAWEFVPLAQMLGGSSVGFALHLGGPLPDHPRGLAWTMAMGCRMTAELSPRTLGSERAGEWRAWLVELQRSVMSRTVGQPLLDWRYLRGSGGSGVIEATYPALRLTVNLSGGEAPCSVGELAPWGFLAEGPGLFAGSFARLGGRAWPGALNLCCTESRATRSVRVWAREATRFLVPAGHACAGEWRVGLAPVRSGAPPAARAPGSVEVAVIDLAGRRSPWAHTLPEAWEAALAALGPVRTGRLTVRRLRTAEEVAAALSDPSRLVAVVNPGGECAPASGGIPGVAMAQRVADYVRAGGLWFEAGGWPFWLTARSDAPATPPELLGPAGTDVMGLSGCRISEWHDAPATVRPEADWVRALGSAWAAMVAGAAWSVNRPPLAGDADEILAATPDGRPAITACALGGAGRLIRFCGPEPPDGLAPATVTRLLEYYWDRSPAAVTATSVPARIHEAEPEPAHQVSRGGRLRR